MEQITNQYNNLRRIGWTIAILNILAMLNSMNYFLFIAKFPTTAWVFLNACFTSSLIFLIGFFLKKIEIMAASIPFLAFFGFSGLFVFSWSSAMIMAQFGHIAMTLAIIYTILEIKKSKEYKNSFIGFVFGLLAFLIIFPVQNNYVKTHPEYLKKLGDPKFEKFINEQ